VKHVVFLRQKANIFSFQRKKVAQNPAVTDARNMYGHMAEKVSATVTATSFLR